MGNIQIVVDVYLYQGTADQYGEELIIIHVLIMNNILNSKYSNIQVNNTFTAPKQDYKICFNMFLFNFISKIRLVLYQETFKIHKILYNWPSKGESCEAVTLLLEIMELLFQCIMNYLKNMSLHTFLIATSSVPFDIFYKVCSVTFKK